MVSQVVQMSKVSSYEFHWQINLLKKLRNQSVFLYPGIVYDEFHKIFVAKCRQKINDKFMLPQSNFQQTLKRLKSLR